VCTEGWKKVAMDGGGDGSQGALPDGDGARSRRVELAAGLGRFSERHEPHASPRYDKPRWQVAVDEARGEVLGLTHYDTDAA